MKLTYDPEDESGIRCALHALIEAYVELCSPGHVAERLQRIVTELQEKQEKLDGGNPWGE
jgi:hypothetical protein